MKVILAEKPSVARDIASVVGAKTKKDGYFEGNGYAVTYAFGHLVTLAEPEEMNPAWGSPWRLEQLPMIPEQWKYSVVDKSRSQFNIIKKLFLASETDSIICATDAGREGEHIFRLIYMLTACKKPVERLWISSLTADAIKDGLSKLKPSSQFDNLASAASARAHADWVVGLNFTRAYTSINRELCTIGRVQTPTLALIVERQKAIDNFQSTPFYEIFAAFQPGFSARYITEGNDPQSKVKDKKLAEQVVKDTKPIETGKVLSVVNSEKKSKAPALYDLLTLQKEANKRFGYTAQETLNLAQSLYESEKLISYPRTESRHLSNDMVDELPRIVSSLLKAPITNQKVKDAFKKEGIVPGAITASLLKPKLSKAYVDDAKLTDHHAIIPTFNQAPANLNDKLKNIYELVVARFLSIFLPPEVRDETVVLIALGQHKFRAKGSVIRDEGWTVVDPKSKEGKDGKEAKAKKKTKDKDSKDSKDGGSKDDDDEMQELPALNVGDELVKDKVELKERKTSAPKPYDDASLLTAMKNAGQELDDEDLASYMKQKGLGTPATRAAIIERLLQTGYVERQKKSLLPTLKGKTLIEQVHQNLKDIALTANWEQKLADMQDGKLESRVFDQGIADFVRALLPDVAASAGQAMIKAGTGIGMCPHCKRGVVRPTPKGAGCNRWKEGCTFNIWREQRGKSLTDAQIKDLVENRCTKVIKGFKKKDGSGTYDARLVVNEEGKVEVSFDTGDGEGDERASAKKPGGNGGGNGGGNSGGKGDGNGYSRTTSGVAADTHGGAEGEGSSTAIDFGACPQCKEGKLRLSPKALGCSRWREGCKFTIWRRQYGREIDAKSIKDLLDNKSTEVLEGFPKKSGAGTYSAKLVMDDDFKVNLSFPQPVRRPTGPEPEDSARPSEGVGAAGAAGVGAAGAEKLDQGADD